MNTLLHLGIKLLLATSVAFLSCLATNDVTIDFTDSQNFVDTLDTDLSTAFGDVVSQYGNLVSGNSTLLVRQ